MKRLLYTPGEPTGIGPDLAILYTQKNRHMGNCQLITIADPDLLTFRAKQLNIDIHLKEVNLNNLSCTVLNPRELSFIPLQVSATVEAGRPDVKNSQYVLDTIDLAIAACIEQQCHGMITGPIHKSIINEAGIPFSGHTEYLAKKTNTDQVVMMLATEGLRVALATTHLPLNKVSESITPLLLIKLIRILHHDLRTKFSIVKPNIFVCALNPHAGECGYLGREEIDIIIPVLEQLKAENILCEGPLPADTVFTPKYLEHADVVLAMYHDQGLPVLKHKGFGAAANITLGLPIIRTSVDHGTALDLTGTGKIDLGSLLTAIDYALAMKANNDPFPY